MEKKRASSESGGRERWEVGRGVQEAGFGLGGGRTRLGKRRGVERRQGSEEEGAGRKRRGVYCRARIGGAGVGGGSRRGVKRLTEAGRQEGRGRAGGGGAGRRRQGVGSRAAMGEVGGAREGGRWKGSSRTLGGAPHKPSSSARRAPPTPGAFLSGLCPPPPVPPLPATQEGRAGYARCFRFPLAVPTPRCS